MKRTTLNAILLSVTLCLSMLSANIYGQSPTVNDAKPSFTAAQKEALAALYEYGGIVIQLDEQRPGKPVVMVDFAGHPEFQDEWLNLLVPFSELKAVNLAGTELTDVGLARLADFKQLRTLNVRETRVSPEGIASLRKALPELVVEASPPKFNLSSQQALIELKKLGGVLVHYDDRQAGNPVIMIDATNQRGFQDAWTRYFVAFPQLRQIGLSGVPLSDAALEPFPAIAELESLFLAETKITDAGLAKLAGCKKLKYLNVEGTLVTSAGIAALRRMFPQLELVAEPEKLVAIKQPQYQTTAEDRPPVAEAEVARKFTAAEIKKWRERLMELGQIPQETPNGWSKSRVDPAKLLTVFPELRLREGYVLRAYIFKDDANSNGFVWALPVDAEFPAPNDCPRIESHFLRPPKPFDALDDMMEVIVGDDSPESYLHASILRRELKEFGGGWHGIQWGMNTVLDDNPWNQPPSGEEDSMSMYPESKQEEWKWIAPKPANWRPEVRLEENRAIVTFYSYTPLSAELDNGEMEKERIIRHTETYRRGKYRPLIAEQKIAEGPNAVAL
jgi:hypothetical protein